jgi:hypothetical protein
VTVVSELDSDRRTGRVTVKLDSFMLRLQGFEFHGPIYKDRKWRPINIDTVHITTVQLSLEQERRDYARLLDDRMKQNSRLLNEALEKSEWLQHRFVVLK